MVFGQLTAALPDQVRGHIWLLIVGHGCPRLRYSDLDVGLKYPLLLDYLAPPSNGIVCASARLRPAFRANL